MIDAEERAVDGGDGARRDRGRPRDRGRRRPTSTRSSRSSGGSRCSTTGRTTPSASCSARSAPRTQRPPRSTTSSRRRSGGSRAPTSPSCCRGSPPGTHRGASTGSDLHATGLATARAARARELLVAWTTASEAWAVVVPAAVAEVRRVHGIDPDGGLHAIRVQGSAAGATRLDPAAWSSRRRPRPARGRAPDRRRLPSHAGPGAHPRARAGAVRSSGRALPGRAPPARGTPWSRWRRSRPRSRRPGRSRAPRRRRSRRPSPDARRARCPGTASRCSPASASPRSIRFHRFLKRTMALEGLFGSADEIVLDVGRRLLATRHVPTLIEL